MSDGFPVTAPDLPRPLFTHQRWSDLLFVHWPVDPAAVAHLYPRGTWPDVFDGKTYVGLIPFAMSDAAVGVSRPIPYFGRFLETNVRLYSLDAEGRHGVLFRSLETSRLAVVPVTRVALGTPYTWARMRVTRAGDRLTYESVRRLPRHGLRAHTRKLCRTWWVPNEHVPFPLFSANVLALEDDLVRAGGVSPTGDRLRALYSPGVRARFGRPSPL